jgi:hypothetical protein
MSTTPERYQWIVRPPAAPDDIRGKPWLVTHLTGRAWCAKHGVEWAGGQNELFAPFPRTPRRSIERMP